MKIAHNKIVGGYKALLDISNQNMSAKTSYALYKIRMALKPSWDFQIEREKSLMEKYGERDSDGNYTIKSVEGRREFMQMIAELNSMEEELDIEPITMELPDINMSIEQIDAISNFVHFTD